MSVRLIGIIIKRAKDQEVENVLFKVSFKVVWLKHKYKITFRFAAMIKKNYLMHNKNCFFKNLLLC